MNKKPEIKNVIDLIINDLFNNYSNRADLEQKIFQGKVDLKYSSKDFIRDFDRMLLRSTNFGGKQIRVNKKGKAYSIPYDPSLQLDFCKDKYNESASIILNGIDEISSRYSSCCKAIDDKYSKRTVASFYRTPSDSRGFDPHFDMDDVIVLQVAGTKKWYFEHLAIKSPTRRLAEGVTSSYNENTSVILEPGDWYFIPAGYVHHAQSLGQESLHMTFSMHSPRTYHLFESLLSEMFASSRNNYDKPVDVEEVLGFLDCLNETKTFNTIYDNSSSFIKETKQSDLLSRNLSDFELVIRTKK